MDEYETEFYAYQKEKYLKYRNLKDVGASGVKARIGDVVKVVKGRKNLNDVFVVENITDFYYNIRSSKRYLWGSCGEKISAENCEILKIGSFFAINGTFIKQFLGLNKFQNFLKYLIW